MTLIIIFLLFTSSIFSAPVTIPQGVSSKWVASYLHEQELIDNPTSFYLYLRLKKLDSKLHSGNFDIPNDSSFSEIANILTGKTLQMISVTIPEGYSLSEISRTLYDNGVISNETEFLNYVLKKAKDDFSSFQFIEDIPTSNLEGYFFPDTYYFSKNSSYKTIARSFFKRFKQVVIPEFKKLNTSNMSLHDVITLASIIEKEAGTIHEMDIISGVFHNRLRKKMFLASCPTVGYAMGQPRKKSLTYKDLEYKSPYNTYKNKGLPPTPIAVPGKRAIIAALAPQKTPFLYFVSKADGSGTHIFSKTLRAHLNHQKKILANAK